MAHQTNYGTLSAIDQDHHPQEAAGDDELSKTRHEVGEMLESKQAHVVILSLTILDVLLVIAQIAATLLELDDSKEHEQVLELFAHASLAIVTIFLLEIFLKIFAFGLKYFWKNTPFGLLHLADALIIIISFLLEVFLKGAEQELGSLLIIFRLWRIVKLTGTVTIKTAEQSQSLVSELQERVEELEQQLREVEGENRRLRAIIGDQA